MEADSVGKLLEGDESTVVHVHFVKHLLQRFSGYADTWEQVTDSVGAGDGRLARMQATFDRERISHIEFNTTVRMLQTYENVHMLNKCTTDPESAHSINHAGTRTEVNEAVP